MSFILELQNSDNSDILVAKCTDSSISKADNIIANKVAKTNNQLFKCDLALVINYSINDL